MNTYIFWDFDANNNDYFRLIKVMANTEQEAREMLTKKDITSFPHFWHIKKLNNETFQEIEYI